MPYYAGITQPYNGCNGGNNMNKLEALNKSISILNKPGINYTLTLEDGIYYIYRNDKYISSGREPTIDDLLHGFITGFYTGRQDLYDEMRNYLS